MKLATSEDTECIRRFGFLNTQRDIGLKFLHQALTQLAAGVVETFLTGEWTGVDTKCHLQRWLIHSWRRQLGWIFTEGDGFTDGDIWDTGYSNDVTRNGSINQGALQPLVDIDVLNTPGILGAIPAENRNHVVWL